MEKRTQDKVELELNETTLNRKKIEDDLTSYQLEIKKLQENIEFSLDALKAIQTKENNLQEELYEIQKNNIKEVLSLNGIKKMFVDSTPFFSSLKNKTVETVQKVKGYVDGTYFDQRWLDEKYSDYKEHCIQKGEEIKTKEEFQKIALALRKMQTNDDGDLNFFDILGKVSKEVGSAKNSVKDVFQSLGFVEKINNALSSIKEDGLQTEQEFIEKSLPVITKIEIKDDSLTIKDKKNVFNEWIETRNIQKSKSKQDLNTLYEDYKLFVEYLYQEQKEELTYSLKGGAFTAALNRTFNDLHQENIPVDGKTIKKVGLKMKK